MLASCPEKVARTSYIAREAAKLNRRYLPPKLDEEHLRSLVQKLRQGDTSVKKEIIHGHLRLASYISGRYGSSRNSDDLESEALYAVTLAVNNAQSSLRDDDITPYIACYVHWHCRGFLQREHILRIPARTLSSKPGKLVFLVRQPMTPVIENQLIDNTGLPPKLVDLLEGCIESPVEREIVVQRIAGYTDSEIAENFGWSRANVNKIRRQLESKFDAIAEEEYRTRTKAGSSNSAAA